MVCFDIHFHARNKKGSTWHNYQAPPMRCEHYPYYHLRHFRNGGGKIGYLIYHLLHFFLLLRL